MGYRSRENEPGTVTNESLNQQLADLESSGTAGTGMQQVQIGVRRAASGN